MADSISLQAPTVELTISEAIQNLPPELRERISEGASRQKNKGAISIGMG